MQAVGLLRGLGYRNVRHYSGGIADWVEHGGPVERGVPGPAPLAAPASPRRRLVTGKRAERALQWLDALANQSFGTLLAIWLAVVLGSGVAYWLPGLWGATTLLQGGTPVPFTLEGLGTALYFSFVTATSVGFGDVVPVGPMRALAVLEAVAGLLVFGCVISKLVSRRQEELVEEIHHLAFEERLDRIRTNHHLVLSELQGLAGDCAGTPLPVERLLTRVESTTIVFAGELRAIHDLLYRPQQTPEEPVLETILASLTATLKGLAELLDRLPGVRERSTLLRTSLRSVGTLAAEICGDCVPREYAPELKVWMDRIQALARGLAPGAA
jgi:hypothetical protein